MCAESQKQRNAGESAGNCRTRSGRARFCATYMVVNARTETNSKTVVLKGSAKYSCIFFPEWERAGDAACVIDRNGVRWRREAFPPCERLHRWQRCCAVYGRRRPNRRVCVRQRWMRIAEVRTCGGLPWRSFWEDGSRGGSRKPQSNRSQPRSSACRGIASGFARDNWVRREKLVRRRIVETRSRPRQSNPLAEKRYARSAAMDAETRDLLRRGGFIDGCACEIFTVNCHGDAEKNSLAAAAFAILVGCQRTCAHD